MLFHSPNFNLYDHALTFISLSDNIKQQFGTAAMQRNKAQFINDQKICFAKRIHQLFQATLAVTFKQGVGQIDTAEETDCFTFAAGS